MKSRITLSLTFLVLALGVALALPAGAAPVHYGTGLYHWVKSCGPYSDGHSTAQYVGASSCPPLAVLPAECHCTMTTYDFPVGNPYPYFRVATGTDENNPGNVDVIIDSAEVIQCGLDDSPVCGDGEGSCGEPFATFPAHASEINPNLRQLIESFRGEIEQQTGTPVKTFSYRLAKPLR
ncbi:MAG TPA: hypothetical protein VGS22_11990 [Thermoanaerobaculia bacterium]|jgi:hypothetical protein|nr:hypothetical protein [Thermoanaerobaculia bacterium]